MILEGPLRNICPTHLRRRCRIFLIRLKLVLAGLASWGIVLWVKRDIILLFAPFRSLIVTWSRFHVSHAKVRIEHTEVSYSRSFRVRSMTSSSKMFLSFAQRTMACAMRALTSWICSAWDEKFVPKYLNAWTPFDQNYQNFWVLSHWLFQIWQRNHRGCQSPTFDKTEFWLHVSL